MTCLRCEGLMIPDWYHDLLETGQSNFMGWHCMNCGAVVDPVIVANREHPPDVPKSRPHHHRVPWWLWHRRSAAPEKSRAAKARSPSRNDEKDRKIRRRRTP
jgi:hypothetical protein